MRCERVDNQSRGLKCLKYFQQDILSDIEMNFPIG